MILLKSIVGSQAYSTATPNSDVDFKSIFHASKKELFGFTYRQQIENSKDDVSYEIKRYLELLRFANPTILEMLYSPDDCIKVKHSALDTLFSRRKEFLTKRCKDSFGGYAAQQIRKATYFDKKMNWEADKVEKKDPIDFCYIIIEGKTYPFLPMIEDNSLRQYGLVNLDHAPNCYALYHSKEEKYRGIFGDNSDFALTSSIPKGERPICVFVYNRDAFQRHRREFGEYETWLKERNTARYVDNKNHNQKIDSKNLLHCRRLLDMAMEIPTKGLIVRRPNAEYLLSIRRGEVNLLDIIKQAEEDILKLDDLYAKSDLPDEAPDCEEILLDIRQKVFNL